MTEDEKVDLRECRWWTPGEVEATDDLLTPRDLSERLRSLLAEGPPEHPIEVGI
jgi:hypothetical protein